MIGIARVAVTSCCCPSIDVVAVVGNWNRLRPPGPVTATEHGVCADPLYVNGPAAQLTSVVDDALPIVKCFESLLPEWFASPHTTTRRRHPRAHVVAVSAGQAGVQPSGTRHSGEQGVCVVPVYAPGPDHTSQPSPVRLADHQRSGRVRSLIVGVTKRRHEAQLPTFVGAVGEPSYVTDTPERPDRLVVVVAA